VWLEVFRTCGLLGTGAFQQAVSPRKSLKKNSASQTSSLERRDSHLGPKNSSSRENSILTLKKKKTGRVQSRKRCVLIPGRESPSVPVCQKAPASGREGGVGRSSPCGGNSVGGRASRGGRKKELAVSFEMGGKGTQLDLEGAGPQRRTVRKRISYTAKK